MKWVISVNNMVYPPLPLLGKKGIKNMINKDPVKENVSTVANPAISAVIANRNLLS